MESLSHIIIKTEADNEARNVAWDHQNIGNLTFGKEWMVS